MVKWQSRTFSVRGAAGDTGGWSGRPHVFISGDIGDKYSVVRCKFFAMKGPIHGKTMQKTYQVIKFCK